MADNAAFLARLAIRRENAWKQNEAWQALYADAYAYAIPNRKPARNGKVGQANSLEIFDATASEMVYQSAAQLRDDIAPPGAPLARLSLNRLVRREMMAQRGEDVVDQVMAVHADLSDAANICFSGTSGFPTALLDVCLDAHIGTGALLVLEGDIYQPVRFAAIPQDELGIETDMFGHDNLITWRQTETKANIKAAFPRGAFGPEFEKDWDKTSQNEVRFEQVWVKTDNGVAWRFFVFLLDGAEAEKNKPVVDELQASCPVITMHYSRVPGEERGRGPVLNALPTIRTTNKVMEIQLKSAAIDLLGIWLYDPHSGINPDTLTLEPGAMWPGQTGGMMGDAIKRLDTRGDRTDIASNLMADLRAQIQGAFQRSTPGEGGKTPSSATEWMVRDKENIRKYRGAYGRMVEDFVPRVFWRVVELVQKIWLKHHDFKLDRMMTQLDVLSPLAVSMRMAAFEPLANYMMMAGQIMAMPKEVDLFVDRMKMLEDMGYETGARPEYLINDTERKKLMMQQAAGMAAAAAANAQANAPQPEPPAPGTPA